MRLSGAEPLPSLGVVPQIGNLNIFSTHSGILHGFPDRFSSHLFHRNFWKFAKLRHPYPDHDYGSHTLPPFSLTPSNKPKAKTHDFFPGCILTNFLQHELNGCTQLQDFRFPIDDFSESSYPLGQVYIAVGIGDGETLRGKRFPFHDGEGIERPPIAEGMLLQGSCGKALRAECLLGEKKRSTGTAAAFLKMGVALFFWGPHTKHTGKK